VRDTRPETAYERPEIDLTGIEVRHDHTNVGIVLSVADARRKRQASFQVSVQTPVHTYDIVVDVPRGCLKQLRWVRVGVTSYASLHHDDRSYRTMNDEWGVRAAGSWEPAYGPRIRPRQGRVR